MPDLEICQNFCLERISMDLGLLVEMEPLKEDTFQFAVTRSTAESGAPVPLVVSDWASKKVSRFSRASLDVEAQASVVAVDALEFSKLFYVGMFVPSVSMQDDSVLREIGVPL